MSSSSCEESAPPAKNVVSKDCPFVCPSLSWQITVNQYNGCFSSGKLRREPAFAPGLPAHSQADIARSALRAENQRANRQSIVQHIIPNKDRLGRKHKGEPKRRARPDSRTETDAVAASIMNPCMNDQAVEQKNVPRAGRPCEKRSFYVHFSSASRACLGKTMVFP